MQRLGIRPSEVVSDEVFLRRVHVDLIGRLPSPDEAGISESEQDNGEQLVDSYTGPGRHHWAGYGPTCCVRTIELDQSSLNYDNWIREQFRENVSYDTFVSRGRPRAVHGKTVLPR